MSSSEEINNLFNDLVVGDNVRLREPFIVSNKVIIHTAVVSKINVARRSHTYDLTLEGGRTMEGIKRSQLWKLTASDVDRLVARNVVNTSKPTKKVPKYLQSVSERKSNSKRVNIAKASTQSLSVASKSLFTHLPDTLIATIIGYLKWYDLSRLDIALSNHIVRYNYLEALKLREVTVEGNTFWDKCLKTGILSWMIAREIPVTTWKCRTVPVEGYGAIAECLPQLEYLDISGSSGKGTDIKALANGLPCLKHLNISGCSSVSDEGMRILSNGLRQLESLNVAGCKFNLNGIKSIAYGMTQLKSLDMSYCWLGDDGLNVIAKTLHQLEYLDVHSCVHDKITYVGIQAIASACPNLLFLDISEDERIGDKAIRAISTGLLRLESLKLSGCRRVSNEGLKTIATGLTRLTLLDISHCRKVGDEVVNAISTGLTRLTSLDISHCRRVSNEGLRSIATGLPNLQSLFIKWSNAVSDEGIRWISTLKQLQKLSIYYLDKITDAALRHIGTGLTQLQSLEIVECKKLSDAGLQHLLGLSQLESLDIRRCEHISRERLLSVAASLPKLQTDDSDDDDESVRDLPPVQLTGRGGAMRPIYYSDNSDDSYDEML